MHDYAAVMQLGSNGDVLWADEQGMRWRHPDSLVRLTLKDSTYYLAPNQAREIAQRLRVDADTADRFLATYVEPSSAKIVHKG